MANGTYIQAKVQCPFYRTDDSVKKRIVCEGFIDGSSIAQTYVRKEDYEKQMEIFCCEHYKKCEVYRMLMSDRFGD